MRRAGSVVMWLILACFGARDGEATTRYHVRMNPRQASGLMTTLAFEYTSSDTNTNTAMILNFVHDGKAQPATHEGGPIFGNLLDGANPADTTTMEDFGFYAEVGVPFDSLARSLDHSMGCYRRPGARGGRWRLHRPATDGRAVSRVELRARSCA